jgi:hypothetical protein
LVSLWPRSSQEARSWALPWSSLYPVIRKAAVPRLCPHLPPLSLPPPLPLPWTTTYLFWGAGTGVLTQGLTLARQALCHSSHSASRTYSFRSDFSSLHEVPPGQPWTGESLDLPLRCWCWVLCQAPMTSGRISRAAQVLLRHK